MARRTGVSLIETLVVIAIIGTILALLLPAVQAARRRAMEVECKNNLHQINLAIAQFAETHKRLPNPGAAGLIGGWTIDVLPFLEQQNLRERITPGNSILSAPALHLRQPQILSCPVRSASDDPNPGVMDPSHYVFVPHDKRKTFNVFDAPLAAKIPWASGPEMTYDNVIQQIGPHQRGFFFARGFQQGVDFMLDGQVIH